ncbi:MAG: tRNA (adenosine(37)-N6)-threonylcarbamoyltransferase complex dimerization subunit type 1 TsaB [Deltaproteobacteria bacterium]|nr:tRNA (adenosine(37)-N6)-threonylcarbamoyltransferase complex dimerization subunit type 1 TsaB [Deltaproteobacteria bacterium]
MAIRPSRASDARVLGIETGGEHLSAALLAVSDADGITLLHEVTAHRGHQHADLVLTLVDEVLARAGMTAADLALVGVGRGPGSFTGIRVGLSSALGLTIATGVPVWPVCSLEAMACHVPRGYALPMFDARRGEVYAGLFRVGGEGAVEVVLAPRAATCEAALAAVANALPDERSAGARDDILIFGSGAITYGVASPVGPALHVGAARHVAWLAARQWMAAGRDGALAPPVDAAYLRRSEAEIAADAREARGE